MQSKSMGLTLFLVGVLGTVIAIWYHQNTFIIVILVVVATIGARIASRAGMENGAGKNTSLIIYWISIVVFFISIAIDWNFASQILSTGSIAHSSNGVPVWNESIATLASIPFLYTLCYLFIVIKMTRLKSQDRFEDLAHWGVVSWISIPVVLVMFIMLAFAIAMS